MDLSGPGIDVKLKERKKERKKVGWILVHSSAVLTAAPVALGLIRATTFCTSWPILISCEIVMKFSKGCGPNLAPFIKYAIYT
jgi:hypothetical protein